LPGQEKIKGAEEMEDMGLYGYPKMEDDRVEMEKGVWVVLG
jgi:hypothetical protein